MYEFPNTALRMAIGKALKNTPDTLNWSAMFPQKLLETSNQTLGALL